MFGWLVVGCNRFGYWLFVGLLVGLVGVLVVAFLVGSLFVFGDVVVVGCWLLVVGWLVDG